MPSAKDTFEANTWEANTFAAGAWRGIGPTQPTVPGIEYRVSDEQLHYRVAGRLHYRVDDERLHYEAEE